MRNIFNPLRFGMINPRVAEYAQAAVWRGHEDKSDLRRERAGVAGKMMLGAAVAPRFPVKIPVFDIHAHREAHVGIGRQLFAGGPGGRRPAELKNGCVAPGNHVRAHFNLDRAAVAGVHPPA